NATIQSSPFGISRATRVPLPAPPAISPRASRADRASTSAYVKRSAPCTISVREACRSTRVRSISGRVGAESGNGTAAEVRSWLCEREAVRAVGVSDHAGAPDRLIALHRLEQRAIAVRVGDEAPPVGEAADHDAARRSTFAIVQHGVG